MGQRANHSLKNSGIRRYWNRVNSLLFVAVVLVLLCKALSAQSGEGGASASAGQNGSAQSSSESTNAEASGQSDNGGVVASSSQTGSAQSSSGSSNAQAPAQSGAAPGSSAQSGNAQGAAQGSNPQPAAQTNGTRTTGTHATPQANVGTQPQEMRQANPYGNMPSMRDLYTQIPSAGGALQRFGSDAFLLGTGNANELPMDLPAGPDYVLGAGDTLIVNMWGGVSNRLDRIIDRQGQIELPEAGTIMIDGMTIARAQEAIQKALSTQFQNEHVEISLGRLRTVRIYVVGDVQRPGAYDVSSLSTPLSALYAAGGPTSR